MSRIESFTRMFDEDFAHGEVITRVEIPLIQRDYAQGRRGEKVDEIRREFLLVLHDAITGGDDQAVGLDFVYGERRPDGTLQPLDGQQRLTTLFLLHWYLAARSGNLDGDAGWTNFTYETRPSARRFCQRLVNSKPPTDTGSLPQWIREQPWYLFIWRYDPTIDSMLNMIDAIAEQFGDVDAQHAWGRLTDIEYPAVSFQLLPLPDMGSAEDLYVKMNSRGKPLTDFENFKARFEKIIEWSPRAEEFAHKADTSWADILWSFRGGDDLVDDEFLRYFDFITEVCEWSDDQLESGTGMTRLQRGTHVFGVDNPRASEHLDFLFSAFDVWEGRDVRGTFAGLFRTSSSTGSGPDAGLPLFFRDPNINLFEAACRSYGSAGGGGNRTFTFGQTLLLLAVVLHVADDNDEFRTRLRTLRNLTEGSQYEVRAERMPRLVADTRTLMANGSLPQPGSTFAVAQIGDEADKRAVLAEKPSLTDAVRRLEDNYILKGSTTAFLLDDTLGARSATFVALMSDPELWWDLTGALLTIGEYQRPRERNGTLLDSEAFQFGTWDGQYSDVWREVLVGRSRADAATTSDVLGHLLDAVAASPDSMLATLKRLQVRWLTEREEEGRFDWRYYLVKYRNARAGASGIYFAHGRRMGYSLTNLPGGRKYRNAYYHDPFLHSIYHELPDQGRVQSPSYSGYEWEPRWLRMTRSGVGIRSVRAGFELLAPTDEEFLIPFEAAATALGAVTVEDGEETRYIVSVLKATDDEAGPDAEDRIQVGVQIVEALVDAKL